MKLAKLLFKPKWQDKDAGVRRAAVQSDHDSELLAALPEIARRDGDAGVRLAALQRLADYEAWRERATGDADAGVRRTARDAYLALLCSGGTSVPAVARRIAELETLSAAEIERVASYAADVTLRREALKRIDKPALLAQRATGDDDPALRLELVERIADTALLERIVERTRKTDKAVNRRARERLQALSIAAGDRVVIEQQARRLCERVEALTRLPHAAMAGDLAALESAWSSLGSALPAELTTRYGNARGLALKALEPRPEPVAPEPVAEPPAIAEPQSAMQPQPQVAAVHAAQQAERAQRKSQRHELGQALSELSAALDAGDSATAHRLHAHIAEMAAPPKEISIETHRQWGLLQERYAELKRWQHWSNNQRRRALCADIENLIATRAHPDAVATRVHEARSEWQRLDAAEGLASDAAGGLARHFHSLCQRALRPTRAYFTKRKEVRHSHADEIQALIARAGQIGDDSADWAAMAALRSEANSALRALDSVEPRQRSALAEQLKGVIARMSALTTAHEREVESAKSRLIAEATTLAGRNDAALAREARELQKRWTALGNGRRATDQKQWREFRAACDAVFGKLDAARQERESAVASARQQVQQLVEEFAALAADTSGDSESARKRLRELDARWAATGTEDRRLVRRQRELRDAVALHLKSAERAKRLAHFNAALDKYATLRQLEAGAAQAATGFERLPSASEFDAVLGERCERAYRGLAQVETEDADARDLLVRLEFLAGIDSPAEDRQRRMGYQVQRLTSRLREGAATSPERELTELLTAWFGQEPQAPALEDRFAAAARAAIDSLP